MCESLLNALNSCASFSETVSMTLERGRLELNGSSESRAPGSVNPRVAIPATLLPDSQESLTINLSLSKWIKCA